MHTDPHPNLLCQAVGRKYVRLYPPSAGPAMYPHAQGMHTNSGRVDVDRPDLRRFPLFDRAPFQGEHAGTGQCLFAHQKSLDLRHFPLFDRAPFQGEQTDDEQGWGTRRVSGQGLRPQRRATGVQPPAYGASPAPPGPLPTPRPADCVLEAGQMLFIPPGWWHYVKSTTVSFSVSFWWR